MLLEVWRTLNGNPVVLYARDEIGSEHAAFRHMIAAEAWESAALALRPYGWHLVDLSESEAGGAGCTLGKREAQVHGRDATLALALLAATCRAEAQARPL